MNEELFAGYSLLNFSVCSLILSSRYLSPFPQPSPFPTSWAQSLSFTAIKSFLVVVLSLESVPRWQLPAPQSTPGRTPLHEVVVSPSHLERLRACGQKLCRKAQTAGVRTSHTRKQHNKSASGVQNWTESVCTNQNQACKLTLQAPQRALVNDI